MDTRRLRRFRRSLRRLERLANTQLRENGCCRGVTLAQCHALLEIEGHRRTTVGRLAEALGLERSTVSRTIDGLVASGLVERFPSSSDRRVTWLALSTEGVSKCRELNRANDAFYGEVFARIPEARHGPVIEAFEELVSALPGGEGPTGKGEERCCAGAANLR